MSNQLNTNTVFGTNRSELLKKAVPNSEVITTLTTITSKHKNLVGLLQTGAHICRDRDITLDYARVIAELEAAKKYAAIGKSIKYATDALPDYFTVRIDVEYGCCSVELLDVDSEVVGFKDSDGILHEQITNAVKSAIAEGKA